MYGPLRIILFVRLCLCGLTVTKILQRGCKHFFRQKRQYLSTKLQLGAAIAQSV